MPLPDSDYLLLARHRGQGPRRLSRSALLLARSLPSLPGIGSRPLIDSARSWQERAFGPPASPRVKRALGAGMESPNRLGRARHPALWNFAAVWVLVVAQLSGCGGGDQVTLAQKSLVSLSVPTAGVTPFISFVDMQGDNIPQATSVTFTVQPRPGHLSRPVKVTQTLDYLTRRAYHAPGSSKLTLPIFGLYAGYKNSVAISVIFTDGSEADLQTAIQTASYADDNGVYDHIAIVQARSPSSALGFDYFFLKSSYGTPVVVDTDGEIRWLGAPEGLPSTSSIFTENGFVVGEGSSTKIRRLEMDGTFTTVSLKSSIFTDFHHNIDAGKGSLLGEFDALIGANVQIESILAAFTPTGAVLSEWDLGQILGDYMLSQGDDPTQFVRPGVDWFHMNASTYDPADDSVIISSRENFLIKIAYQSKEIIWIFGDPTKYWHSFPSLRAKALTLDQGGLYPIGQHGISLTTDGKLLLFNNGYPSFRQPTGAPAGESRSYSAVSAYDIHPTSGSVTEAWRFDYGQSLQSDICSNAYQAEDGSVLVNYSAAEGRTKNIVVGLDVTHRVAFRFEFPTTPLCQTSFNSQVIPLDSFLLQ
jgi:arylsulfate sulfotransferase